MPEAHNKRPFQIIPWQRDFLPALLNLVLDDGPLEQALFIFPHSRPARYLKELILKESRIGKPCLLPEILPVHQVFQAIRNKFLSPAASIGRLDQIGLIWECAKAEKLDLPVNDAQVFFPWGAKLADLFEDCFIQGIKPVNFHYLEDELAPYAANLLAGLAELHEHYMEALTGHNWTTSGFSAFQIVEKIRDKTAGRAFEDILSRHFIRGRRIYIAGFYSPNGSENILFHKLWSEYAATIAVHADAKPEASQNRDKAHWSCAGIEKWRRQWNSGFKVTDENATDVPARQITYYAGYDLHSQLQALQSVIDSSDVSGGSAVILPDTGLLLPVLHHIRNKDLNISMGYPLENTPLNRLLENVLALQENKYQQKPGSGHNGYYWKDCLRLVRHPYIKMLLPKKAENGHAKADLRELWRNYLHKLDKNLREGRRFTDLGALMREVAAGMRGESVYAEVLRDFAEKLVATLLEAWENLHTAGELAEALAQLCFLLTEQGEELWRSFPIDAECLYRFMQGIVPELNFSALRAEKLPPEVLFAILRRLIAEERVAFEADPLTAMQVMGLLESRLLSFKQVFILEATDDLLPGGNQNDPLLPDGLRHELGLPDIFRRQQMTAYYFYRLLAGAEQIHLFWEEGTEKGGLLDAKKLKSRFVEELLWEEEQKLGRILKPAGRVPFPDPARADSALFSISPQPPVDRLSDGPLNLLTVKHCSFNPGDRGVNVSGSVRKALDLCLFQRRKGLSASMLNLFLNCPLAFYYQEVARLKPVGEIMEDDDPLVTGELLHKVFSAYYAPTLGRVLRRQEQSHTELINCFRRVLRESSIPDTFPQDALIWLRRKTPVQLHKYLEQQPEETRIIALEAEADAEIRIPDGTEFNLTGRLDRIDERILAPVDIVNADAAQDNGLETWTRPGLAALIVLDYKTGKVLPPRDGFWNDSQLWKDIKTALKKSGESDPELFSRVADGLNTNIQLPMYLYLLRHGRLKTQGNNVRSGIVPAKNVVNAAWVELRDEGKECFLLPEMLAPDETEEILDLKIPALLAFILGSMKNSREFAPRRNGHCAYCPYAPLCVAA